MVGSYLAHPGNWAMLQTPVGPLDPEWYYIKQCLKQKIGFWQFRTWLLPWPKVPSWPIHQNSLSATNTENKPTNTTRCLPHKPFIAVAGPKENLKNFRDMKSPESMTMERPCVCKYCFQSLKCTQLLCWQVSFVEDTAHLNLHLRNTQAKSARQLSAPQ